MRLNKSPWLHNLPEDREHHVLRGTIYTDIVVVGGGIAGMTTAYMLLANTNKKITLIEGDLIAHGATGHNAGYVVSEFEKDFKDIVKEYGLHMARSGQEEIDSAWGLFFQIREQLGLPHLDKLDSQVAYSSFELFLETLHEDYLKYGKFINKVYINENSDWFNKLPEEFKPHIQKVTDEEFKKIINVHNKNAADYHGIITNKMVVANSALFTEKLAKYCAEKYHDRFQIYEKTFVNSIRLLQNNSAILDSATGLAICDKVVLCTNGFENFDIYGPYGLKIDKDFHYNVSGLVGYMIGTFRNVEDEKDGGGVFYDDGYNKKNVPLDAGPYIYYSKRYFNGEIGKGQLFCVGGPEIKLHDRRVYNRDHEVDENIYNELQNFQKNFFTIKEEPIFKWHGLMGYTKSGIRIVGRDRTFSDLFYNLGCNGIGIIPSIAGAKRILKLINGEKLEPSIFDPR